MVWCYCGAEEEAEELLRPVREAHPPRFEHLGTMPYLSVQSAFDAFYPKGYNWYWRGDFVKAIADEAITKPDMLGNSR
ncbi:hypothetical protein [Pontibacter korlensis]|uniref:hypothetical protein n=1 Tax=Pontibacter korlensis TaxID=400092 RepID=UPI000697BF1A